MRVAIVYFTHSKQEKMRSISQALAKGIESQGFQVDIINAKTDSAARLSHYTYIVVGVDLPRGFSVQTPEPVIRFLKQAGVLGAKRSFAFILNRIFRADTALRKLMQVMEAEGMYIKNFAILANEEAASATGAKLRI